MSSLKDYMNNLPGLDTLVSKQVMKDHLNYSTDISAAWAVVEALRARGMHVYLDGDRYNGDWRVVIYSKPKREVLPDYWNGFRIADVTAKTAPLAICLAALEAIENE